MYHYKLLLSFYVFLFNTSKVFGGCEDEDTKRHSFPVGVLANTYVLVLVILLAWILFLLLLGTIKALVGLLCCPAVGLYGLSALTELPIPLEHYFEPDLQKLEVHYDLSGWPIHPYTSERSVRVLSKVTEFSLNVIFFIAYPLVVCDKLCSMCCFKAPGKASCSNDCYQSITRIRLMEEANRKGSNGKGPTIDMYYDEDVENEDTQYVLNQLQQSKEGLLRNTAIDRNYSKENNK